MPAAARAQGPVDGPTVRLTLDDLIAARTAGGPAGRPPPGSGPWAGPFRSPRRGRGMDFDDLRPYVPGDDVRHIDWKVSARMNEPHVRLYREERDHAVTLVLDLRDSMFTGSVRLRAVAACLEAARRAWRCADEGSRVGLVTLDADGIAFSRAAVGERGALAACGLAASRFAARADALDAGKLAGKGASDAARRANGALPPPTLATLVDRLLIEGRRLGTLVLVGGLDDVDGSEAPGAEPPAASLRRLTLLAPTTLALVEDPTERTGVPVGRYRWAGRGGVRLTALGPGRRRRTIDALTARREAIVAACRSAGVMLEGVEIGNPA